MRAVLVAAIACAIAAPNPTRARAQVIHGTVVDASSQRPVIQADVTLLDSVSTALRRTATDSAGLFRLAPPGPGTYTLRAEHIGHATTTAMLTLQRTEEIQVELRMGVEAIPLEPLLVVTRRPERFGRLTEFYDRLERRGRAGFGTFITRKEIEARFAIETTDLFRLIPGVTIGTQSRNVLMTRQAGGCAPAVYVDGMMLNRQGPAMLNDFVVPEMIEGIEVYRGAAGGAPVQYESRGGCGVILIWTRAGSPDGRPFSWWRMAVGGALLAGLLLMAR
jgi:hypothetical protein